MGEESVGVSGLEVLHVASLPFLVHFASALIPSRLSA